MIPLKTPINRERLAQHWTYSWWKYLLAVVLCVAGTSMLFTVTEPQIPQNEKLEVFVYGMVDEDLLDAKLEEIRAASFPDQKQITCLQVMEDDTYGPMALMAHLAAGEGDIFVLPRENYQSYADQGIFLPLEDILDLSAVPEDQAVNYERAWRRIPETEERHLYGVPLSAVEGLAPYCRVSGNPYVGVRVRREEDGRALRLLLLLMNQEGNVTETDN